MDIFLCKYVYVFMCMYICKSLAIFICARVEVWFGGFLTTLALRLFPFHLCSVVFGARPFRQPCVNGNQK